MQPVTDEFIAEQLKPRSKGSKWDIKIYAGSESKDLTPFFIIDSLSRIERRIEQDLTEFKSPDIQFSMWYDEEIWDWLQENDDIKIEVYSGFPFEIIKKFWGYIDKDNLKKNSLGRVDVRAYGYVEHLRTIKTKDIFGSPASPAVYVPLQDTIKEIFDHLNITNQTIKILPRDTYPNAEDLVLSYLGIDFTVYTEMQDVYRISNHKFVYTDGYNTWLVSFSDEYSEISHTIIRAGDQYDIYQILKWGDDRIALIKARKTSFNYPYNGYWAYRWDYQAYGIVIYDTDGNFIEEHALSVLSSGGYKYYPLAKSVLKFDRLDYFVVGYVGAFDATPININISHFKIIRASDYANIKSWTFGGYFMTNLTDATTGYYSSQDYFFTFLADDYLDTNLKSLRIYLSAGSWVYWMGSTGYDHSNLKGKLEAIGQYVCISGDDSLYNNTGQYKAFNVHTNQWVAYFWDKTPDRLGHSVKRGISDDPYQIIIGYNIALNKIEIKTLDASNNITTLFKYDMLPTDFSAITGFTYWRTYKNKPCSLGIIKDTATSHPQNLKLGIIANQFYPFIKRPPLTGLERLTNTLRDLATAGCCIFDFPDDDTGIFISRAYWLPDDIYPISPLLFTKTWSINKILPRRVIVESGAMKVEVGDEVKSITISTDYIPDYDDDIGRAYGQSYRNFLSDYLYEIEIYTDFLIQYEPLDLAEIMDRTGLEKYQGRLMKIIQEGMKVKMELRGKKL